ncbi:hypothetical protein COLO4_07049 [Corchorus olitorius]|uniref:J domain-containing protein n=1 Tax=Corchorus olitorius TaxID=93759 RepID=A0A1R3KL25_9ROSI|nr:hypothetical protein COLO4_07049 [Corchorus olitorius]
MGLLMERHWPMVCSGCVKFWKFSKLLLIYWKECIVRGFQSCVKLGSASLLVIMWSCFLSLTSMSCLLYVLLSMGAAGAAVQYLGYTPGLFIVGLFGILILWMYANFWITGTLFIVGVHLRLLFSMLMIYECRGFTCLASLNTIASGYLFSLSHARLIVLIATTYSVYFVKVRVGWLGVFLSINLAFFSNDVLNYLLQCFDNASENMHYEEQKESKPVMEDDLSGECEYSIPTDEPEKVQPCKSSSKSATTSVISQKEFSAKQVVKEESSSADEMKRILNSTNHYEALGFARHIKIDAAILKKEYRKKAMLVHPDKNMGSPLASESFKKLQCAYEVLSDSMKKRDYDEQLRKEESRTKSVCQKSHGSSRQCKNNIFQSFSPFSRLVQIIAPKNQGVYSALSVVIHIYGCAQIGTRPRLDGVRIAVNIIKPRMEMDGLSTKVEIPRAFVCAESKIFDVSEWAICQGMACRPNTHRPSFHVNMVGLEKTQRSNSSRYPWDLDAEMIDEDEEEFELWLQQALASGLFCETSKRRKSWSPFKLPQKKSKRQWRRTST